MSIKQNLFAALFLCTLTGHAFAATEIHKPDNNLEQLSKVSMSTHNSNPAGVESQIKEKAEELQASGNDSNLLIVFYVQIMPDDFVMQLHRF